MAKEEKKAKKKRPTAEKRNMQNKKRRIENRVERSKMRTSLRRFNEVLTSGNAETIAKSLSDVYSILDKAAKKGLLKTNTAARTKARLTAKAAAKK